MQDKICDEAADEPNPDSWLSASVYVPMSKVLQVFRQEYLTTPGSNAKDLSPKIFMKLSIM